MTKIQFIRKLSADGKNILYAWFEAMHTRIDMLLCSGTSYENLELVANSIQCKIDNIEKIANRFEPRSELYFVNNNAFDRPCNISEELTEIIEECLIYNKKTYKYFDITVNSLNNYRSGIENICFEPEKRRISYNHPDIQIDLNGYIKGYSLRFAAQILRENNITDALISMGSSSILAMGNHPQAEGWSIGLDPEFDKNNTSVTLFNECFTTSGNSLKNPRHIINPETGEFVKEMNTVSVITADPALGEILSTAFFVANNPQRQLMLKELPVRLVN